MYPIRVLREVWRTKNMKQLVSKKRVKGTELFKHNKERILAGH